MQEKIGLISDLKVHPKFDINLDNWITPNGKVLEKAHICNYIADFSYIRDGNLIVEDTKGRDKKTGWDTRTPTYKLKKKLMSLINNIEISEI